MSVTEITTSDPKITFALKEIAKGRSFTLTVRVPAGYAINDKELPSIDFKIKGLPNEQTFSVPIYKM